MKLTHLFFLLGICTFHIATAQNDTIWYDKSWEEASKENAVYYRPSPQAKDNGFWIKDYYISGAKQMEGFSKRKDMDIFDGVVTWFTEKGEIYQQAHYKNGFLNGEFVTYTNGKEAAKAIYKNEKVESGTTLQYFPNYDYYLLQKYKEGKVVKETAYEKKPDERIRIASEYGVGEQQDLSRTKFYDKNGTLIGELTASLKYPYNTSFYNGKRVTYYYKPMQKKSEIVYEKGLLKNYVVFYPSGKVREQVTVKNDTAFASYFDESGKTLAKLTALYTQSNADSDPWSEEIKAVKKRAIDGTKISFKQNHLSSEPQKITRITTYKNGKIEAYKDFHENGKLKEYTTYKEGVIVKHETYTEDGEVVNQLTYKEGKPYNGIDTSNKTVIVYKDGQVVENTKTHTNGAIQKKETGNKAIYYDRKGKKIGTLEYKLNKYGRKKPYKGDDYQFLNNGQVSSIKSYKDGKRTKIVNFNILAGKESGNKPVKEKVTYYNENGEKSREEIFYDNGQRRADITYQDYSKEKATYYDKNGKKLSAMVFLPKKNGTEYVFVPDRDYIYAIETYSEGELTYEKKYARDYRSRDDKGEYPMYLQKEIDYNGKASFYDTESNLIAEATYKNGAPWEGKVVKGDASQYTITSYRNGKREGDEIKYSTPKGSPPLIKSKKTYLNDKLNGMAHTYFDNGELSSIENYKNGILDGETIYYAKNGTEKNRLVYKNGAPYEGLFINKRVKSRYAKITEKAFYKAGALTKAENWENDRLSLEANYTGNQLQATEYDDSGRKTVFYNMTDIKNKNGEIIYYAENGTEKEKGTIIQGQPASGVFYLKEFFLFPEEEIKTIKLEITGDNYTLYGFDEKMEEVVHISENKKGPNLFFLGNISPSDYFYNDLMIGL